MPKITELYAWVIADGGPDDEGVPAFLGGDGLWYPMIGADLDRAMSLRDAAEQAATLAGKPCRLMRSTGLEQIDVVGS